MFVIELPSYLYAYKPVLAFIFVGLGLSLMLLFLSLWRGPHRPSAEKNSPYECGFSPFKDTRGQFDLRYYLVGILFIIFDVEIAFLFPWATNLHQLGMFGFCSVMFFLFVLAVGFVYEWKRGALEWE